MLQENIETNTKQTMPNSSKSLSLRVLKENKWLPILLIFVFICSCDSMSGNSDKERKLMDSISEGMSKKEVMEILGEPDSKEIVRDSIKYGEVYYFFTTNKSGLRSEMPFVFFDSTGQVKSWYY